MPLTSTHLLPALLWPSAAYLHGSSVATIAAGPVAGPVTIVGTENADTLVGSDLADTLSGGAGDDDIKGYGGDDKLDGGDGHDRLEGGDGNDELKGGNGTDVLRGGAGDDSLVDGDFGYINELFGDDGNDVLTITAESDGWNRMYGGTGDDRLIGNGGRLALSGDDGNDHLLSTRGGSLSGGNGDDYLSVSGSDAQGTGGTLQGDDGNDILVTTSASGSRLYGGTGDDLLIAGPGRDWIVGGTGLDRVRYATTSDNYTVKSEGEGIQIVDKQGSALSGTDSVREVERIEFPDLSLALDVDSDGIAGQAYRIYRAAFDRAPDKAGMGFWLSRMDNGASLVEIAAGFIASKEFTDLYGTAPSNADLVTRMYTNILHRAPEPAGYAYWLDVLDARKADLPTVLAAISESGENKAAVATLIADGIPYTPYGS